MDKMDITPKWRAIVPRLVLTAIKGDNAELRNQSMDELLKLADIVDNLIAKRKKAGLGMKIDFSEEKVV